MKAIRAERFGNPEVLALADVPEPKPGPRQVVIAVSAIDTLFLDAAIRRGDRGPWSVRPPYIPGCGVAGEIIEVGPDVDSSWLGRRVAAKPGAKPSEMPDVRTVASTAAAASPIGGYAEAVAVAVEALVPVDPASDLRAAAAVLNDGMTAMLLTAAMPPRQDERVLVMPAAGGAGSLLIQLARAAGATVIAAGRGTAKLASARASGADLTLDYSDPDWTEGLTRDTGAAGIDLVFDGVGGSYGRQALDHTKFGGRFVAFGAPGGAFTPLDRRLDTERGITAKLLPELACTPTEEHRLRVRAVIAATEGTIRPSIGLELPLEAAEEAHRAIEARQVIGKTLLTTRSTGD